MQVKLIKNFNFLQKRSNISDAFFKKDQTFQMLMRGGKCWNVILYHCRNVPYFNKYKRNPSIFYIVKYPR